MSAKNRDNKNRWRNITVGFRVSPEENELINRAVALSGLPKQEYCYRRCLNQDVVVQGNPRVKCGCDGDRECGYASRLPPLPLCPSRDEDSFSSP